MKTKIHSVIEGLGWFIVGITIGLVAAFFFNLAF
jgi:hypothetical protein